MENAVLITLGFLIVLVAFVLLRRAGPQRFRNVTWNQVEIGFILAIAAAVVVVMIAL